MTPVYWTIEDNRLLNEHGRTIARLEAPEYGPLVKATPELFHSLAEVVRIVPVEDPRTKSARDLLHRLALGSVLEAMADWRKS